MVFFEVNQRNRFETLAILSCLLHLSRARVLLLFTNEAAPAATERLFSHASVDAAVSA
jgi:hypothetical protein